MKTRLRQMLRLTVILGLPLLIGCSGPGAAPMLKVSDLGLTLELPPGWQMERGNPRLMFDVSDPDNRFGLIEDYPSEGKSLEQQIKEMTRMDAASIRSRQSLAIGGYPAVELISEAEFALIEVVVLKDDRIIRVSFRVEPNVFPMQAAALRKSLHSIQFPN